MNRQFSNFTNKVVVITGASSGFGKGAALKFAEEGANVVLAARRADLLETLARECEAYDVRALAVPTDVARREDVERLAQTAVDAFGRIDVWVNAAGVGALGRFDRIPLDVHEDLIHTDLLGTLYGCYYAHRQFLRQGAGILINISSELGKNTVPHYTSYSAAKHGVAGLSDALQQEIAQEGIKGVHVCVIMPAAHDTPFFDHAANYTGHEIEVPNPLHDPHDVVDAILRLAHDPEHKEIVSAGGILKDFSKRFMATKQTRKTRFRTTPVAADSPGAVRGPMRRGTAVSAGRR